MKTPATVSRLDRVPKFSIVLVSLLMAVSMMTAFISPAGADNGIVATDAATPVPTVIATDTTSAPTDTATPAPTVIATETVSAPTDTLPSTTVGTPGLDLTLSSPEASMARGAVVTNAPVGSMVLYDHYTNPDTIATSSQKFGGTQSAFDDQAADDFIIPVTVAGWSVQTVEVAGKYTSTGTASSVNVMFYYAGSGYLPGTQILIDNNNLPTMSGPNNGDFVITLKNPVNLGPGQYWVSVQANQDTGQWAWYHTLQQYSFQNDLEAAWINTGGGFGKTACTSNWGRLVTDCGSKGAKDLMFRLDGNIMFSFGSDSSDYYSAHQPWNQNQYILNYDNFVIPEVGIGKNVQPFDTPITKPDPNPARRYAYWFLCNDRAKGSFNGAQQADRFAEVWKTLHNKNTYNYQGNTLFVDVEHNLIDSGCNWGSDIINNQKVLDDFLIKLNQDLNYHNGKKISGTPEKIGVYASVGDFPGIMGDYTFSYKHLGFRVVVWMAWDIGGGTCIYNGNMLNPKTWPSNKYLDLEADVADYAVQYGVFTGKYQIGGVTPEIWQYCNAMGDYTLYNPAWGF